MRVLIENDILLLRLLTIRPLDSFPYTGSRLFHDLDLVLHVGLEITTTGVRTRRKQTSFRDVLPYLEVSGRRNQRQHVRVQRGA